MLHGGILSDTHLSVPELLLRPAGGQAVRGDASHRSAGGDRIPTGRGVASPGREQGDRDGPEAFAASPEQAYQERMRQRFPGGERMLSRDLLASLIREMSGEVEADARGRYVDRYL